MGGGSSPSLLGQALRGLGQRPQWVTSCCLLLALLLWLSAPRRGSLLLPPQEPAGQGDPHTGGRAPVALSGTQETIFERQVVWQIPSHIPLDELKGVAFYAHGCSHSALDFWPKSAQCPQCVGLPEDKRLTRAALARGYAVIAVTSLDQCWQAGMPASSSEDVRDVTKVLRSWREAHGLEGAPAVALGASSGGYFISCLAHATKFQALVIIISSGVRNAFIQNGDIEGAYPPTLFVHMPKDGITARRVAQSMQVLQSAGVPTAEIKCREMKLDEHFFSSRMTSVSPRLSQEIFRALQESGQVNGEGYLLPVFRNEWQNELRNRKLIPDDSLVPELREELHLAFGWHEMTSEFAEDIVDWFQGVCRGGLDKTPRNGRCETYG